MLIPKYVIFGASMGCFLCSRSVGVEILKFLKKIHCKILLLAEKPGVFQHTHE